MNGDYIKIVASEVSWFKEGTECFLRLYPEAPERFVRPTLEQFCQMIKNDYADFLGLRISQLECEETVCKAPKGSERWDCEWCSCDEFYFRYANHSKEINRNGEEING